MRVGAVGTTMSVQQYRPVARPSSVGTGVPAATPPPVSTGDQAAVLAAATMTAAPMPDAALVGMMQAMAGLTSGTMF